MKWSCSRLFRVPLVLMLLALPACSFFGEQPPTQFFVLSAAAETGAIAPVEASREASRESAGEVAVGVAPVEFPEYLNRREVVTRSSSNELVINRYYQWASPLRGDFERVLAANLGAMIPTRRATVLPFRRAFPLDYEVRMSVDRFERLADGTVVLDARWAVLAQANEKAITIEDASIRIQRVANDYPSIVAAMSRAIADLSRKVADNIRAAPPPGLRS